MHKVRPFRAILHRLHVATIIILHAFSFVRAEQLGKDRAT